MNRAMLAMAVRNLVRHPRRTTLTLLAIAIGLSALIFLWGFSDGLHRNMIHNFQSTIIGSLEVHRAGFFKHPDLARHIDHPEEVAAVMETAGATRWSERLVTSALAAGRDTSAGVLLIAVDPVREPRVTSLPRKVTEGRFFEPGDGNVCILGATTARNLGVVLGDRVALMAYDRFGALAADDFTLIGIITSGEIGIDQGMIVVPLAAAQELLDMAGKVTSITASISEERLEPVASAVRKALQGQGYEVMRWYDMFPVVMEWVVLHDGFLYVFLGIVLLIVLTGVLNTVLLSMIERTREFGVLMALGARQHQIAGMVITESLLMGVIGTALGAGVGIGLVMLTNRTGIDLSLLLGSTTRFYVDPVIRTQVATEHLWLSVIAVLLTAVVAGLYPAWRAAQLEPVEAIRHV